MMHDIIPPSFGADHADDGLKLVSFCPVCHERYNPLEAKVIDENQGAHLLHVRCRHCQSTILALILASNLGISSIGLVTDLDSQEIGKFKNSDPVGGDDVLDVYQSLEKAERFDQIF